MTNEQLAYIAGIIDGEGCIAVSKVVRNTHKSGYVYQLHLVVTNTDRRLLEYLKETTLLGSISIHAHAAESRSPAWAWSVGSVPARRLLEKVMPYLVIKREQAALAIEFHEKCKRRPWVEKGRLTKEEN